MKNLQSHFETGENVDQLVAEINKFADQSKKTNQQSIAAVLSCIKVLQANSPLLGEDVLEHLEYTRKTFEKYAEELTSMEPEKKISGEQIESKESEQVEPENQTHSPNSGERFEDNERNAMDEIQLQKIRIEIRPYKPGFKRKLLKNDLSGIPEGSEKMFQITAQALNGYKKEWKEIILAEVEEIIRRAEKLNEMKHKIEDLYNSLDTRAKFIVTTLLMIQSIDSLGVGVGYGDNVLCSFQNESFVTLARKKLKDDPDIDFLCEAYEAADFICRNEN